MAAVTGTQAMLFTDIEGSTGLVQRLGSAGYGAVLAEHHRILRAAIAGNRGVEVKTEGDSFFALFARATDALAAVVQAQLALAGQPWPDGVTVNVRMGVHTGEVVMAAGEYTGLEVHRAARIAAAAHGGQVLISEATRTLAEHDLPPGTSLRSVGEHMLRGLDRPERLHQLLITGLRTEFPPVRTASSRLDRMPTEVTSFIGRERVMGQARELLAGTRLLTLTGPGGTGKTRLAQRLARDLAPELPDGVAFVALASITQPDLVASTIRQQLGHAEEPGRPALDTVVDALRDRRALVVLDNFEQVLQAAPVVAELLERTSQLKVIVTSRSVLQLQGEQEFPVPPLELPQARAALDVDLLSRSEAVALFVQRARAARPGFEVSARNAPAVVEICARLDGLPLAIELAASRIRLLTPEALLARLGSRLDLLQSSGADRTDRQRTLRGAIDWSYDLLAPAERALFRRLAIFVGGCSIEDAEAVVPQAGGPQIDVFEGIAALAGHSLLRQVESDGEARFTMLETIREYGLEQLAAAGELAATASAHGHRFAALAAEASPQLTSGAEWADRLERDHDNLRAMLSWAADNDVELALKSAGAIWRFWHLRGHLREGRRVLGDLLARPAAAQPTVARAVALVGYAGLVYWMRDHDAALASYEEALPIARDAGDRRLEGEILYSLGYVYAIEKQWAAAESAYSDAARLFDELDARIGRASADMGAGMVASLQGDHARAVEMLRPTLERFSELGDTFGQRNTQAVLTRALMHLGQLEEARSLNRQNIEAAHMQQDVTALSAGLLDLATLEALAGDAERAARLVGASEALVARSGGEAPPQLINRIDPIPLIGPALDAAALQRLTDEGRRLSTDEAVAYALAGDANGAPEAPPGG